MSVAGALALVAFGGGAVAAGTSIARSLQPQWNRIVRLALGNIEPMPAPPVERWRSMHMAADRRRPFQEIRVDNEPRRRGLPGWMVRR